MKVVSIVGARPQFIKAAVLSRELRKEHSEILVHTGQHYDENMSSIFFQELGIPEPDYSLKIGSGMHGAQTGAMLAAIEPILLAEKPNWVIVYGDTNSTLAGALAAAKLHIPVAHIEAGLRSYNRRMPEEINRILTDHVSDLLLCPTQTAVDHLNSEGIQRGVYLVGDLMHNALLWSVEQGKQRVGLLKNLGVHPQKYVLATVHRAENTDDPARLSGILNAFNSLNEPLIWPVHPRTRKKLDEVGFIPADHIKLINPVGSIEMAQLESSARVILTDSGGVQKEAYWLGVPCVTLRDETEWVETVSSGWNKTVGADPARIMDAVLSGGPNQERNLLPADSHISNTIIKILSVQP